MTKCTISVVKGRICGKKWRKRGGNRIRDSWTMVMQVKIPFNAFAFCGMVWYADVWNGL